MNIGYMFQCVVPYESMNKYHRIFHTINLEVANSRRSNLSEDLNIRPQYVNAPQYTGSSASEMLGTTYNHR